jgi:signal transduction histidine kinase
MTKASSAGLSYFDQLPCPLALMDETLGLLWANDAWEKSVSDLQRSIQDMNEGSQDFIEKAIHSVIWIKHFNACLRGSKRSFQDEMEGVVLIWRMSPARLPYLRSSGHAVWVFFQPEWGLHSEEFDQRMNLVQQAKLKELGELAASIAHEVNNPLAVIYARASFLRERMGKGHFTMEMALENLEKICLQSNRIVRIIRGLRNFSRDSSRDPFSLAQVSYLIDDAVALVNEQIRVHGIELKVHKCRDDLTIECRPTQILQVLLNLLKNAIEAVSPTTSPKVDIWVRERKDFVDIIISDSGPGVPENLRSKIFAPFFTTKEIGVGTGLGLSVSAKIVESHQGQLTLDTEKGDSSFRIRLPVKQMNSIRAI